MALIEKGSSESRKFRTPYRGFFPHLQKLKVVKIVLSSQQKETIKQQR